MGLFVSLKSLDHEPGSKAGALPVEERAGAGQVLYKGDLANPARDEHAASIQSDEEEVTVARALECLKTRVVVCAVVHE